MQKTQTIVHICVWLHTVRDIRVCLPNEDSEGGEKEKWGGEEEGGGYTRWAGLNCGLFTRCGWAGLNCGLFTRCGAGGRRARIWVLTYRIALQIVLDRVGDHDLPAKVTVGETLEEWDAQSVKVRVALQRAKENFWERKMVYRYVYRMTLASCPWNALVSLALVSTNKHLDKCMIVTRCWLWKWSSTNIAMC